MKREEVIYRFELGVECGLARSQRGSRDRMTLVAIARQIMRRETQNQACASGEVVRTFRHSLVRFRALAIACPSFTNTQPTGTSSFASASSAYGPRSVTRLPGSPPEVARAHHDQRLSHPGEVDGVLLARRDVCL
jgi:hypothetical protein